MNRKGLQTWALLLGLPALAIIAIAFLINDRENEWDAMETKHLQIRGCIHLLYNGEIKGQKFPELEDECKKILAEWDKEQEIRKAEELHKFIDTFGNPKDDYKDIR